MRGVVVAMLGLGLAQPALAADLGVLRGSFAPAAPYKNWEGLYAGGQIGTGGGGADFSGDGNNLVAEIVRFSFLQDQAVQSWSTTGRADTGQAVQYGAFLGYNGQWGDVVIGLEGSYNHTNLTASSGGGLARLITYNDFRYAVNVASASQITLTDFGTIRARFGWAVDRFLPYLMGGVALGRASYGSVASVSYPTPVYVGTAVPPPPTPGSFSDTATDGKSGSLIYGWSAGLGMDIALTPSIFIRGEYEFIQFSQMRLNLNNARLGAGFRF